MDRKTSKYNYSKICSLLYSLIKKGNNKFRLLLMGIEIN